MLVKLGTAVAAATAAMLAAQAAHADPANYRTISAAAACVPSATTLDSVAYRVVDGAYEFAPNQTGRLEFFCPVPIENGESVFASLAAEGDDDGASTAGYYVKAYWSRRRTSTGGLESLCTATSNSAGAHFNPCVNSTGWPSLITLDHIYYINVVRVIMYRSAVQPDGRSIRFAGLRYAQ